MTRELTRESGQVWQAVLRSRRSEAPAYDFVRGRFGFGSLLGFYPERMLDDLERDARQALQKKLRMARIVPKALRAVRQVFVKPGDPAFASGRILGPDGKPLGG